MKKRNFGFISLSLLLVVIASGVLFGQKSADLADFNDFRQRGTKFGNWSAPVNLGPEINSTANESAAVLSKDGRTLYFTSDRPGSIGDEDIWVAHRVNPDDPWGTPESLGPIVNSGFMDRLRSISPDGRILLFQSNRTGSVGDLSFCLHRCPMCPICTNCPIVGI
ncbi:MAG: TolB family protein [Blastocatellia bacterium]